MKKSLPLLIFLFNLIVAVNFIIFSYKDLPLNVAIHFNLSGFPNSFMSKNIYFIFILSLVIFTPSFIIASTSSWLKFSPDKINIPNKDYWMLPEKEQETIAYYKNHVAWLASIIVLFIAFIHWLIIDANQTDLIQLSNQYLLIGLGIFLAALVFWIIVLRYKFKKIPTTLATYGG